VEVEVDDRILSGAGEALRLRFGADTRIVGCRVLPGQASSRTYYRVSLSGAGCPATAILVKLPEDPFGSEEAAGSDAVQELPFCSVLKYLESAGIAVPRLYHDGASDGFVLQEDLGDVTLFKLLGAASAGEVESLYAGALNLLVAFQKATALDCGRDSGRCVGHSKEFTLDLLKWELDHFKEWGLLDYARAELAADENTLIDEAFDDIAGRLKEAPYILAHRDFQSTNILVSGDRLVLIDFQDALMAPPAYDLVALLRDSYIQLSSPLLDRLVRRYFDQAAFLLPVDDWDQFSRLFHLQTLQRKLKDAGRFVFIDRKKGNPSYLKWVEPTLGYVANAFDHLPEYGSLRKVLASWLPALR